MAQLSVPRFLIESDTSFLIGKALNYSPDTSTVTTHFELNNKEVFSRRGNCINSLVDTLAVVAGQDSIPVKYYLEDDNGYFDGELRNIPVYRLGLEETKGAFMVLDRDTSIIPAFDTALGKVNIYASSDVINVMESEISHLIYYLYTCNEQLASKLKALLAEKTICEYRKKDFRSDREVKKIIRLLEGNKKKNDLWGWWKDSDPSLWISEHVLEALLQAEQHGYSINLNKNEITESLIWELENKLDFDSQLRDLCILYRLNAQVDFRKYLARLEAFRDPSLNCSLQLLELKQLLKLPVSTDTLNQFKKTTLFGGIYYSDNPDEFDILSNDVQNTILAYKILRADSADHDDILRKIRIFFFENRSSGYWRNTYESAKIIETILPDVLRKGENEMQKAKLEFTGAINKQVTIFPLSLETEAGKSVTITKTGDYPVFLTYYQRNWNPRPVPKKDHFEITTNFRPDASGNLKAGSETKLVAQVNLKKDLKFVMINIPVPGGCSYGEKVSHGRFEEHREYFRNELAIFCSYLPKGSHSFEINLLPRYTGSYTLNPAKIELMYFPTFSANNASGKVRIR
jgi:hypothetical protein